VLKVSENAIGRFLSVSIIKFKIISIFFCVNIDFAENNIQFLTDQFHDSIQFHDVDRHLPFERHMRLSFYHEVRFYVVEQPEANRK